MGRVAVALMVHELFERTRDKWVVVVSVLFALLAGAVSLYGRDAGGDATALTGPSLVTLASLLVPLVALVLSHDAIVGERERNTLGLLMSLPVTRVEVVVAKFLGRGMALVLAVVLGLGAAVVLSGQAEGGVIVRLMLPTVMLGLAFLSLGMLISSLVSRQVTAASLVVVVWFSLVFFYDLGLLGLLVATDGAVSQSTLASLVLGNPAGLYRIEMMQQLVGADALADMGLVVDLPGGGARGAIWAAWIVVPVALSGLWLTARRVLQ